MAITQVQLKSGNNGNAGTSASLGVTLDAAPTAGNMLIVAIATTTLFGTLVGTGMEFQCLLRSGTNSAGAILAWTRVLSSPGSLITFTPTAASNMSMIVVEYSSTVGVLRLDRMATAIGSSTSPASGATSTTNTAVELWVGAIAQRSTGTVTYSSPTNSFTLTAQSGTNQNSGSTDRTVAYLERIVSSTGTPNAGVTSTANNNWGAIVAAFEETVTPGLHSSVFGG